MLNSVSPSPNVVVAVVDGEEVVTFAGGDAAVYMSLMGYNCSCH